VSTHRAASLVSSWLHAAGTTEARPTGTQRRYTYTLR
jgi:hypothetical protein